MEFLPLRDKQSLLDYGCGNGLFIYHLLRNAPSSLSLSGYDPFIAPTSSIEQEQSIQLFKKLEEIPSNSYDLVTALDCIEHIEDDKGALAHMHRFLNSEGFLLLTVPAFMQLYSMQDASIGHYRRYNKKSLQRTLEESGFSMLNSAYFFPSLIFPALFRRYYLRIKTFLGSKNYRMHIPLDHFNILSLIANIDFKIMRKIKFKLPVGFFLVAVAQKRER